MDKQHTAKSELGFDDAASFARWSSPAQAVLGEQSNGTIERSALRKIGWRVIPLVALAEWDEALADLEEMGFGDGLLNRKLLLKHGGSLKRTVKELVQDA